MSGRLNPKLTKRVAALPAVDQVSETSSQVSGSEESASTQPNSEHSGMSAEHPSSVDTSTIVITNPRIHLLHSGKWIPKQFDVGRPVPYTGIWNCCSDTVHLSMYCESMEVRENFTKHLADLKQSRIDEDNRRMERKEQLHNELENIANNGETLKQVLTMEEKEIQKATASENGFNAPMIIAWLVKHHHEDITVISGLKYILKHLATGEGCFLMQRHGLIPTLIKIHLFFPYRAEIHLLILQVLKQLLDCNYTRGLLLKTVEVLKLSFVITHRFMSSEKHVENGLRCITQCCRSEVCRVSIIREKIIGYALQFGERFHRNKSIIRSVVKLLNWITTDKERMKIICNLKGLQFAVRSLIKYTNVKEIVSPALFFIARAIQMNIDLLDFLLKKNIVPLLVKALALAFDEDLIQLEGLKLLQFISKTPEGWKQIENTRGAWQNICQGTPKGDALIHKLPGAFNNPGWCIGETPYLPAIDRQKLLAAKMAQSSLRVEQKAAWTASSLREFMGLSMTGQTLAINTEFHDVYFELVCTLDILPEIDETREHWYKRVRDYEKENMIRIEEMVYTVQEMKKREADRLKMLQQGLQTINEGDGEDEFILGTAKELFVNGEKITTKLLEESDKGVDEQLQGII